MGRSQRALRSSGPELTNPAPSPIPPKLMADFEDRLTDAATSLGEGAADLAENLPARAAEAWESVQHRTDRAARESAAYVRGNPVPTALAAFGFGLVLGLLLSRRDDALKPWRRAARETGRKLGW